MAPLVAAVLGGVVRAVIAAASGGAVATAPSVVADAPMGDDVQLLLGAVGAVISIAWSMWQKYRTRPDA